MGIPHSPGKPPPPTCGSAVALGWFNGFGRRKTSWVRRCRRQSALPTGCPRRTAFRLRGTTCAARFFSGDRPSLTPGNRPRPPLISRREIYGVGLAAAPLFELWGEFAEFLQYYSSIRLCIFCSPTGVGFRYGGAGGLQHCFLSSARFLLRARVRLPELLTAGQDSSGRKPQLPPGRNGAQRPHLLFPSSMPKRRAFPPRALRGPVEPQQFPWVEGYPVFLPIPSVGKSVRVLRGRIILELTGSAPETSGLRRQGFAPYKTLLMPAFSLPRPPGELALPPSPANGTFHYPTPFHRLRAAPRSCSGIPRGGIPLGWKSAKPRLRYFAQPRYIGEGCGLNSTELLRFLCEEPPPRLLRKLLGISEETEPIPGELGCLGAGQPAALGARQAGRPPFRGYSSGPGAVKHLSRGRRSAKSKGKPSVTAALGDGSFQAYPVEGSAAAPFSRGRRFRDLNRWSGLFPSRPWTFAPRV